MTPQEIIKIMIVLESYQATAAHKVFLKNIPIL